MRTRKKPSKRSLIKKLQNGGTGDPKKPVVTQSAAGFPIYKEDGELTASPATPFYTTTGQRGYYPGVPIGLPEAEVVADSGDALGSVDRVVEDLGGGIFGDYAALPAGEREKFEDGVRDAIGEGGKIALIATSPLLAIAAAPMLASGLQGYGAVSQLPLLTVEGQTALTVGGGLDALGMGLSINYLPEHIKDFKENPSLGNAAYIGLDLLGFLPAGNAALQSYRQSLRAGTSSTRTPITLASGESATTRAALEGNQVRLASAEMNNIIKEEIRGFTEAQRRQLFLDDQPLSLRDQQDAINETLDYWNRYLNTPQALEKIIGDKEFFYALAQGDRGFLLANSPLPPQATGVGRRGAMAAESAIDRYMMNTPYFATRDISGRAIADPLKQIRTLEYDIADDGAVTQLATRFYSNTKKGREEAAKALLYNLKVEALSAKNAMAFTRQEVLSHQGTRGAAYTREELPLSSAMQLRQTFSDGSPSLLTSRTEFFEGAPSAVANYGYTPSDTQIKMLIDQDYEAYLTTLVHETNHAMLIPYLDMLADMQKVETHMLITAVDQPMLQVRTSPLGVETLEQVFPYDYAIGFKDKAFQENALRSIVRKYAADPRLEGLNNPGIVLGEQMLYMMMPHEVLARTAEIKFAFDRSVAVRQGLEIEDWLYNFTPQRAEQALDAWIGSKESVPRSQAMAEMFFDGVQGATREEKLKTLASLLNKTFTNTALIGGTSAAVATQADITGTPTKGPGLKRGGYISKKKKRRGYRSV